MRCCSFTICPNYTLLSVGPPCPEEVMNQKWKVRTAAIWLFFFSYCRLNLGKVETWQCISETAQQSVQLQVCLCAHCSQKSIKSSLQSHTAAFTNVIYNEQSSTVVLLFYLCCSFYFDKHNFISELIICLMALLSTFYITSHSCGWCQSVKTVLMKNSGTMEQECIWWIWHNQLYHQHQTKFFLHFAGK